MSPLISYVFTGPHGATIQLQASGLPEVMVMMEELVNDADLWFCITIGMNAGEFLRQGRAMLGIKQKDSNIPSGFYGSDGTVVVSDIK